LLFPSDLFFLPPFLLASPLLSPYFFLPEAMQPPNVDHGRRPHHHTGNTKQTPYRGFSACKAMLDTAYCRFHRRPQIPPFFLMLAQATPAFGALQVFPLEVQRPRSQPFLLRYRATMLHVTGSAHFSKDRYPSFSR
jgi:hypothetical protein